MIGTVMVHGSDGEVMAPAGLPTTLIRGKRQKIRVTALSSNEEMPLSAREALVGMVVSTIFTKEQLGGAFADQIPDGSRIAYGSEIIELFEQAGKRACAEELKKTFTGELDMWVFPPDMFELVS